MKHSRNAGRVTKNQKLFNLSVEVFCREKDGSMNEDRWIDWVPHMKGFNLKMSCLGEQYD